MRREIDGLVPLAGTPAAAWAAVTDVRLLRGLDLDVHITCDVERLAAGVRLRITHDGRSLDYDVVTCEPFSRLELHSLQEHMVAHDRVRIEPGATGRTLLRWQSVVQGPNLSEGDVVVASTLLRLVRKLAVSTIDAVPLSTDGSRFARRPPA